MANASNARSSLRSLAFETWLVRDFRQRVIIGDREQTGRSSPSLLCYSVCVLAHPEMRVPFVPRVRIRQALSKRGGLPFISAPFYFFPYCAFLFTPLSFFSFTLHIRYAANEGEDCLNIVTIAVCLFALVGRVRSLARTCRYFRKLRIAIDSRDRQERVLAFRGDFIDSTRDER